MFCQFNCVWALLIGQKVGIVKRNRKRVKSTGARQMGIISKKQYRALSFFLFFRKRTPSERKKHRDESSKRKRGPDSKRKKVMNPQMKYSLSLFKIGTWIHLLFWTSFNSQGFVAKIGFEEVSKGKNDLFTSTIILAESMWFRRALFSMNLQMKYIFYHWKIRFRKFEL